MEAALTGLMQASGLTPAGASSLRALIRSERHHAGTIIGSGSPKSRDKLILDGWAFELRILTDGRRQIFSVVLPGDVVSAQAGNMAGKCTLVALTPVRCADVTETLSRATAAERDELADVMDRARRATHDRRYSLITSLHSRSAGERLANLLLELHERLDRLGRVQDGSYAFPLTQEHLADLLGLSTVHVNRSLRALRLKRLATVRSRRVSDLDRDGLGAYCEASDRATAGRTASASP